MSVCVCVCVCVFVCVLVSPVKELILLDIPVLLIHTLARSLSLSLRPTCVSHTQTDAHSHTLRTHTFAACVFCFLLYQTTHRKLGRAMVSDNVKYVAISCGYAKRVSMPPGGIITRYIWKSTQKVPSVHKLQ